MENWKVGSLNVMANQIVRIFISKVSKQQIVLGYFLKIIENILTTAGITATKCGISDSLEVGQNTSFLYAATGVLH